MGQDHCGYRVLLKEAVQLFQSLRDEVCLLERCQVEQKKKKKKMMMNLLRDEVDDHSQYYQQLECRLQLDLDWNEGKVCHLEEGKAFVKREASEELVEAIHGCVNGQMRIYSAVLNQIR